MALKPRSVQHKVHQESYALLLTAIFDRPRSTSDLEELTGLSRVVIQNIGRCFVRHNLLHVGSWAPDARGVHRLPVWTWGPGEEAPRSPPKSRAAIAKACRLRKKQAEGRVAGTVFAHAVEALAQPK